MQAQKSGSIVNISSIAGVEPEAAFPTSSVFRAGLASFAKIFADQHAAENIRMNNVLPGFVDNFPIKDEIVARIPIGAMPGRGSGRARRLPRLGTGSYITGQNIRIDGGMTRSV